MTQDNQEEHEVSDYDTRSRNRKTNVTLDSSDTRNFKRLMLDWEEEYDFPIELKESHALNAAVRIIIRASKPELVDEYADRHNVSDEERKQLHSLYSFFLKQYLEMLNDTVYDRISSDKRRVVPLQKTEI